MSSLSMVINTLIVAGEQLRHVPSCVSSIEMDANLNSPNDDLSVRRVFKDFYTYMKQNVKLLVSKLL